MLHLIQCRATKPYWKACIDFTTKVLLAPNPQRIEHAVIFGQWRRSDDPDPLGPEEARAFLRHAFNVFFHDFCNVNHKNIPFQWESTYLRALLSLKSAVLRRGKTFAVLYANRCNTALPEEIAEDDRDKFSQLIKVRPHGKFEIAPAFLNEIDRARTQLQNIRARS